MSEQSLFTSDQAKINACITFLQSRGYKIIKYYDSAFPGGHNAKSVWEFFRNRVIDHHPAVASNTKFTPAQERGMVSKFIKARMDSGLSKEQAYVEIYRLINTVFEREPYLNLSSPIVDFSFFIADGTKFMINKILEMVHINYLDDRADRASKDLGERVAKETQNLEATSTKLDTILKNFRGES